MRQGLIYKIKCNTCFHKEGKEVLYIGETARTGYDRGQEWWEALQRQDTSTPLEEHSQECHPEEARDFTMEVINFETSPLFRQVTEAEWIQELGKKYIIMKYIKENY